MELEKIALIPIRKLLSDLYETAKGPLKQAALNCLTSEAEEKRNEYASRIAKVKTIWQIDKPVNVEEFYHPTTLQFDDSPRVINDLGSLFRDSGRIIIEGIAGQGKSIFLRFLTVKAVKESQFLPVFIQLRHISNNTSLNDLVDSAFESLGIVTEPIVREYLLRKGKVVFLLDGFDEIDGDYRSDTIRYIEENSEKYRKSKVVISSRPNSDIQHSASFSVIRIKPLLSRDREKLIKTLVVDGNLASRIIHALKGKRRVSGVLTTPLLVTLLVITYKAEREIPEHLSDFYKALFLTLLKRHDKTKPGFVRERKSSLGNIEFERVFETLCFIALNEYKISMNERQFYDYCERALSSEKIDNFSPHDLMYDITHITSLVILDGDKYYFLHKSIPEYFAAQKMSEEKDSSLKEYFYKQLRENDIPENWYQTIYFLSEIDEYHYLKLLLIPYYCSTFGVDCENPPRECPRLTKSDFLKMIGERATIRLARHGDEYKVEVDVETKNWLVNTHLYKVIDTTVGKYVNNIASDLEFNPRDHRSGPHGGSIDLVFERTNSWVKFMMHLNSDSELRKEFNKLKMYRNKLENRNKAIEPVLHLKL